MREPEIVRDVREGDAVDRAIEDILHPAPVEEPVPEEPALPLVATLREKGLHELADKIVDYRDARSRANVSRRKKRKAQKVARRKNR